jgi:Transposase DDE domain
MFLKTSFRNHPELGSHTPYYRLVESYRNIDNRVCHQQILNIGFWEDTDVDQKNKVVRQLRARFRNQSELFEETDQLVIHYVEKFWRQIVASGKYDFEKAEKMHKMVDLNTIQHSNVREIGAEWMCYNTWNELKLTEFFTNLGWSDEKIKLATTQVISRAIYPASELGTVRWIKENSAICDVTGYDEEKMTKDKLYQSSLALFEVKDCLEKHLSKRTNELFDLQDKIILFDLTNTYFEGEKRNSKLAKFGRSKEKRSDARLVVLAMVVNIEGFIKYSSIHEGNYADSSDISEVIDNLAVQTGYVKPIVVIDAGIATEKNLQTLDKKGYKYVAVSRSKIKDYEMTPDAEVTYIATKAKKGLRLKKVKTENKTDYFLEVNSVAKRQKEAGMKSRFDERFEALLKIIKKSIHSKGGVKKANKVHERIGRAKQKYPSAQLNYDIKVTIDSRTQNVTTITWTKETIKNELKEDGLGIYFLRTNLDIYNEVNIWVIYNTIREIESVFRSLKTDLDLRPIYHKNDDATMAHLHLAILAYWLVNTIRYQLKNNGINHCWSEVVRIANTQKKITTSGQNTFDKTISIRKCSEPTVKFKAILDILKYKHKAFKKLKSVVHKPPQKKLEPQQLPISLSG